MTVVNPPAWLQAGSYPAHTYRLVTSSIVETPGIVQVGDLSVSQNSTPGMSVVVAGGRAFIEDGSAGGDVNKGMYNFVAVGDEVKTISTAHATWYRVDLVVARVQDSEISGSVDSGTIEVLDGTAASTLGGAQGLVPAVPDGAISLATVTVGPSATAITDADITNTASTAKIYADMSPGFKTVTSSSRPTGNARVQGMRIFETDTLREWTWSGSSWLFRGGKGPKAFVSRPGSFGMVETLTRLSSLEPATGNGIGGNFETAYFTFVDQTTAGQGDRIRVLQAGLYTLEIFINMVKTTADYTALARAEIATGSTGLPTGMVHFPALQGKWVSGRAEWFDSRTVYLPEGAEIAYQVNASGPDVTVDAFWASATLIG